MGGRVARVVECLPCKHETMRSNPSTPKKENKNQLQQMFTSEISYLIFQIRVDHR
jgi:hypothetical protein